MGRIHATARGPCRPPCRLTPTLPTLPLQSYAHALRSGARHHVYADAGRCAEGADWREVSLIVLHIDPDQHAERAKRAFDSHLARAKWMSREGYKHLLRYGWPSEN
jgi:hypothetical protein